MATGTVVDVVMPQMGVSVSEGTVTRWLKNVGDTVQADEPLLEISTDKVDTEVPSPGTGVLQEILVQEGETVDVGTLVARIGPADGVAAAPSTPAPLPASVEPEPVEPEPVEAEPVEAEPVATEPEPAPAAPVTPAPSGNGSGGERHSFVSPVVARIASEHGIDPAAVTGTGRDGRVTKKDILAFVESGGAPAAAAPETAAPPVPAGPSGPSGSSGAGRSAGRSRANSTHACARRRACTDRGRRDGRADDRDAPRNRRAHAPLPRHRRTCHERDRGRHVQGGRDPAAAERRLQVRLRRQPHLSRVRLPRDGRDAPRLPVRQRRDPRRVDRHPRLRQPRLRGRSRTTARD